MNQLADSLKKKYGKQFSVCHWVDVDAGNKRVFSPADGTGYVYCDGTGGVPLISLDNNAHGDKFRAVIMSYPIFQTDKGTIIDFKNVVPAVKIKAFMKTISLTQHQAMDINGLGSELCSQHDLLFVQR